MHTKSAIILLQASPPKQLAEPTSVCGENLSSLILETGTPALKETLCGDQFSNLFVLLFVPALLHWAGDRARLFAALPGSR